MVRPFYRNIRLLILTMVMIVVWGMASYQSLPRQEDPTLVPRIAVVNTLFPGASAERVESLVTEVIESQVSEIEEVKTITSTSRVGFSTVLIELQDAVSDAEPVWSRIRDKLSDANSQFPAGAVRPALESAETRAYALIAALTWDQNSEPNYAVLRRYAEELQLQLRGVAGTENVEEFGAPTEEIKVQISAPELAAVGLNAGQLAQQIDLSDAKVTAGQLRSPKQNLAIEVDSELDSLEQIRQIPIQSNGGQFARLGDVARVSRGVREPLNDLAIVDGKRAIALGALMESGQRIDLWAKAARLEIANFQKQLPGGISLDVIFDQSNYVADRLNTLINNLLFGALLVVGVTFVAMGWRSSLVVGTALPLTICAVLGLMSLLGVEVHQMSVTGLIIALGLLIDNAVVAVDEIQTELKRGMPPEEAVAKTVNYLAAPLFASTLTTMLTFLPIVLLPGPAGEFVGSIALTVILSLGASLLLSLTVIAAMAGRFLGKTESLSTSVLRPKVIWPEGFKPDKPGLRARISQTLTKPGAWWNNGFSSRRLGRFYRWTLEQATARPIFAIVLTMVLPVVGFVQAGSLEQQFFPSVDRDQFQIEVEFASERAIASSEAEVRRARDLLLQHDQIKEVQWFVGESAPKFFYNFTGARQNSPYYAQAMVQLTSDKGVRDLIKTVQTELDRALPEARVLVRQLEQGPPFEAPVELRIYGPNLDVLRELGIEVREILTTIPDVTHVRDSLSATVPKLALKVDEEQAQLAGLNNAEIARQLEATLEGAVGGSVLESTESLLVRVQISDQSRGDLSQIASLNLQPTQTDAPRQDEFRALSALGKFDLVPQLAQISHRNEKRVNTVQAFITAGVLPSKVLANFQSELAKRDFRLPPGYATEIGGEQAESGDAVGALLAYVGLLLLLMGTTLVLSLGSFRSAAIVAFIGIGSVGMALLSLWTFGSLMGFMAVVGIMGLIGIAVNGGIIIISAINEDEAAKAGSRKAIQDVVVHSTRHVLTTTITTMVGFIPLLMSGGAFWQPLAIAIAGGIGGSPFLALYFTPAAYLMLHRGRRSQP